MPMHWQTTSGAIENPLISRLLHEAESFYLIEVIGDAADAEYLKEVKDVNITKTDWWILGKDMRIVYTPLHGTGKCWLVALWLKQDLTLCKLLKLAVLILTSNHKQTLKAAVPLPLLKNLVGAGADVLVATYPDATVSVVVLQKDEATLNLFWQSNRCYHG